MTLTYRSTVGRRLTVTEADGNISWLANHMAANVKDHGAVGDGTTNDASSIQAAIDSLTNGGTVFFPPGVYILSSQINIPLNIPITLLGSGIPTQATGAASGTELRSTVRDGSSIAIDCEQASVDFSLFAMENLYLSGGTYTEVTGGPGQGGSALGNFVGLSLKRRLRWVLRNVRIAGFDTCGFRYEIAYYGSAYSSSFMWNGIGVDNIDGGSVDGFYNCHFQYNGVGTVDVGHTFNCAWEGQWNSGAKYDIAGQHSEHYSPYFESNNESETANDSDIYCDTTNFPASLTLHSPRFVSGSSYSAYANATHNFNGKCTRFIVCGAMSITRASPQNYALFKLVGATTMLDYTGTTKAYANFVTFTAGSGEYKDMADGYLDVTLAAATLTHFNYPTIRLTAGGAINLDSIASGWFGMVLKLLFGDGNVTVRDAGVSSGNIQLAGATAFVGSANDTMLLLYDPNGDTWKEISRAAN